MSRTIGTMVRGIRAPIVREGDDLIKTVVGSIMNSLNTEGYQLRDKDVIGITESLVARAQGNYVTIDEIAAEIKNKFQDAEIGLVFPILSRNRFAMVLKGIARGAKKIHLLLSYPSDEMGNHLMEIDKMDEAAIVPAHDVLTEADYRKIFGIVKHPFTGIDYVQMYKDFAVNDNISIYFANDPTIILKYTDKVLVADIHTRQRTKKRLQKAGAALVYCLDDLCTQPISGNGYNPVYGLLGSNLADDERLKLFPRNGQYYVDSIQKELKTLTGKDVEVLIYGDGAFKDPVGKIWELADPVISPAFTSGLGGTPNELKIKYFADHQLKELTGETLAEAVKCEIRGKEESLMGSSASMGTTPRQLTDLLGSLCDLTSGSGDKGTPIVLVQGYFDTFASE